MKTTTLALSFLFFILLNGNNQTEPRIIKYVASERSYPTVDQLILKLIYLFAKWYLYITTKK